MMTIQFTIPDILLLLGLSQCLYIIIYLFFRSGRISRGSLPLIYFFIIGVAFALQFLENTLPELFPPNFKLKWALWALEPALCILLIVQIAQIYKVPSWQQYWVLLPLPVAYVISQSLSLHYDICLVKEGCNQLQTWLSFTGILANILVLGSVWFNRRIIQGLQGEKTQRDRYWLILALIFTNAAYIATMILNFGLEANQERLNLISSIYGLVFVYLSGTSLFRIYPQAVRVADFKKAKKPDLSIFETSIAEKIEDLIYVQKVYQEPNYSRADMARECEAPEATVSKVINLHFEQSFPQLLNQYRVEDAKQLLLDTDVAVNSLADEVGFNSLASFNRVFKELTGVSPSKFRKDNKK